MTYPAFVPIFIALGAISGALSRYHLTRWTITKLGSHFPYGSFMVNLSGSFLIGLTSELFFRRGAPEELILLLSVGFLGAYTTFSTYELDAYTLFETGKLKSGWLYWLGSPVLGFFLVEIGAILGRQF